MVQGSIGDVDLMTRVNQLPAQVQAAARYSPLAGLECSGLGLDKEMRSAERQGQSCLEAWTWNRWCRSHPTGWSSAG